MPSAPDYRAPLVTAQRLTAPAALLLTAVAALPLITPTVTVRYFAADPRAGDGGWAELGPLGIAGWQLALAVASAVAAAVAVAAGARVRKIPALLLALGVAAAVSHMIDANARWEDWLQGGTWVTAAGAGGAASLLAQHAPARRWIVGLLVALALPLAAEAAWYVGVQHPASVAFFEANRDALLAARGILPGSERAVLYERRLRFADATGAMGFSNVLATLAVATTVAAAGVALRAGRRGGAATVAALAATASGFVTVWLTASKGGLAAVAAGFALLGLAFLGARYAGPSRRIWKHLVPAAALGLIPLAIAAVLIRGAAGPPPPPEAGFVPGQVVDGERSLLFRAQYWRAAARMTAEHPWRGVGASGFADTYPAAKDPLNPETVTNAHNVFVDQVTMLGIVGGGAWTALLLCWLGVAGRGLVAGFAPPEPPPTDGPEPVNRRDAIAAFVATAALFGVALVVQRTTLLPETALLWLVTAGGFAMVAAAVARRPGVTHAALGPAAAVVLFHSQVEMSFFQPASAAMLWVLVGAAAGVGHSLQSGGLAAPGSPSARAGRGDRVAVYLASVALVVGAWVYFAGVARHERSMAAAAAALTREDTPGAVQRLGEAQSAAGLDTRALRWRVRLHTLEPMAPLVAAGRADEARARADEALGWIEEAGAAGGLPALRLRVRLWDLQYQTTGQTDAWERAEAAYAALTAGSPYHVADALAWAEHARRAGRVELARERYRRVLELREQKYLDAADPLTPEQLERVRAYLTEAGSPVAPGSGDGA
ncbi:MAG: O-antigen ligase family protein [Planctomycetota bacterium]